jgi:hypothetical protein
VDIGLGPSNFNVGSVRNGFGCWYPSNLDATQCLGEQSAYWDARRFQGIVMSAAAIARRHFEAALAEAKKEGCGTETISRHMIDAAIAHQLKLRSVDDVQREMQFITDTLDPETDFIFMRP